MTHFTDKPCAAPELTSYRYRGRYGWIMIGATDDADAMNSARRSLVSKTTFIENLQIWNGEEYVAVGASK